MKVATNCQWRGGVYKRNGISIYDAADWSAMVGFKGAFRAYLNSAWTTIVALDDDSFVRFYQGATTTVTVIDNDFHFTKGYNVQFSQLGDYVIAVNGVDKPAVIYYSGGFVVTTLEALDTRTREDETWYAGQYTASGTVYTDDTTDAQDAGTDDYQIVSTTNGDGCFIACTQTFNKVVFKGATQAAGSPASITYAYWNGSAWTTVGTLVTTPDWTAAAGDRTLEFNIPLSAAGALLWEPYGESTAAYLSNLYVIRIVFGTAPSGAVSCDYLELSHTQYLTQIMENERPSWVVTHGSRVHLISGNIVNISPFNAVTGWRAGEVEYFQEGGTAIKSAVSFNDALIVFKANTIYSFTGNSYETWVKSQPLTSVGTVSGRSVVSVGGLVFFVARDGIYAFDGSQANKVSKHIQTDIDSWTLTNACGVGYQKEYWVSFPTNSITLTADPDSMGQDETGDWYIGFFKFTGYKVSQFLYCNGDSDTGYLLAVVDQSSPYLARCDSGDSDNTGSAADITMTARTRYINGEQFLVDNVQKRVKVLLGQVSAASGRTHTVTLYGEDGAASAGQSVQPSVGTGYTRFDLSIPYTLDGRNLAVEVVHSGPTKARLVGVSLSNDAGSF